MMVGNWYDDMENWSGPHATERDAIDDIIMLAGDGRAVIWQKVDGFYINDGCDPDTGGNWGTIPDGARWINAT